MRKIASILFILSLLWLASCGGNNNNGENPIPRIPSVDIIFSNSQASFEIGNDGPIGSSMNWGVIDDERTQDGQPRNRWMVQF